MSATFTYRVVGEASFGGFSAELLDDDRFIFVRAKVWKGDQQPRIVINRYERQAFDEWISLMKPVDKTVEFNRSPRPEIADNLYDQWLVH